MLRPEQELSSNTTPPPHSLPVSLSVCPSTHFHISTWYLLWPPSLILKCPFCICSDPLRSHLSFADRALAPESTKTYLTVDQVFTFMLNQPQQSLNKKYSFPTVLQNCTFSLNPFQSNPLCMSSRNTILPISSAYIEINRMAVVCVSKANKRKWAFCSE